MILDCVEHDEASVRDRIDTNKRSTLEKLRTGDPIDTLIIGGGFAATVNYVSGRSSHGNCFAFCEGDEPWRAAGDWPMGQPAAELGSVVFPVQPCELGDAAAKFCPASAFSRALSIAQAQHEVPLVEESIDHVSRASDGWVAHTSGGTRFQARRLDIASGIGPSLLLDPEVLSQETHDALVKSGRVILATHAVPAAHFPPSAKVLIIGGGGTGAWWTSYGAPATNVCWLGQPKSSETESSNGVPPSQVAYTRKEKKHWLRTNAFSSADTARNGEVFDSERVTLLCGRITRVTEHESGAIVEWTDTTPWARGTVHADRFDHVVIAIGFDSRRPGGAQYLLRQVDQNRRRQRLTHMAWDIQAQTVVHQPDWRNSQAARLLRPIGLTDGAQLRVLGAAVWSKTWTTRETHSSMARQNLEAQLALKAVCAPAFSRGVHQALYQADIDIVLANGGLPGPEGKTRHANLQER